MDWTRAAATMRDNTATAAADDTRSVRSTKTTHTARTALTFRPLPAPTAVAPLPSTGNDAVDKVFAYFQQDLNARRRGVVALEHTLASLQRQHELFDDADYAATQAIMEAKREELARRETAFNEVFGTYQSEVAKYKNLLELQAEKLIQLDKEYNTLSDNQALANHFVHKQKLLREQLALVEGELCQKLLTAYPECAAGAAGAAGLM